MSAPLPPAPIHGKHQTRNPGEKQKCGHSGKPNKPGEGESSVDDAYGSCSECGYDSVCTYESCSCAGGSVKGYGKNIPPPKQYQSSSIISTQDSKETNNKNINHDAIKKVSDECSSNCD